MRTNFETHISDKSICSEWAGAGDEEAHSLAITHHQRHGSRLCLVEVTENDIATGVGTVWPNYCAANEGTRINIALRSTIRMQ